MTEETQPEIQAKVETMATGIMEMDALMHALLKLGGLDQEEVHLRLTHVLYHEGMG